MDPVRMTLFLHVKPCPGTVKTLVVAMILMLQGQMDARNVHIYDKFALLHATGVHEILTDNICYG